MKKNLLALFLILCFVTIIINSCSTTEIPVEQESKIKTTSIEETKAFVNANILANGFSSKNQNTKVDLSRITQEKINNSNQLLTVVPLITNDADVNSRLVLLNVKGETKAVIINMHPDKNSRTQYFSGKMLIYSPDNKFVNGFRFENGIAVSQFIKTKSNITNRDSDGGELNEVIIYNNYREPRSTSLELAFFSWDGGDSNGGGSDDLSFTWDSGGGSSGSVTTLTDTQKTEEQINAEELDACTKAILDKLKNLGGSDIAEMLSRFSPSGAIFNINMSTGQVKNNDPNIWAQTTKVNGSNTDINMVFNQDYINGKDNPSPPTDLSVAATMAHEVIHAYLISLLEENKTCGASGICDFPTIYEAYVQQQITKDKNNTLSVDAHHELIADNYVNTIASTLQEFNTSQSVYFPYQVYLDIAWGGLQGTVIFNKNYPNDPNHKNYKDRVRILARINAEKYGSQYGVYSPLGTPCKK